MREINRAYGGVDTGALRTVWFEVGRGAMLGSSQRSLDVAVVWSSSLLPLSARSFSPVASASTCIPAIVAMTDYCRNVESHQAFRLRVNQHEPLA